MNPILIEALDATSSLNMPVCGGVVEFGAVPLFMGSAGRWGRTG